MNLTTHVSGLAAEALKDHSLLLDPIPFFEEWDRAEDAARAAVQECPPVSAGLDARTAGRLSGSYAFADAVGCHAFGSFCPPLRASMNRRLLRHLWAAAVLIDHYVDEDRVAPERLAGIRTWVAGLAPDREAAPKPKARDATEQAIVALLEPCMETFERFRLGLNPLQYQRFQSELERTLDAELATVGMDLRSTPDDRVRAVGWNKSVLPCWVSFCACVLESAPSSADLPAYRRLCTAIGEVLWIVDDLMDIEEDLDRGIWNRTLWQLHDRIGADDFRSVIESKEWLLQTLRIDDTIPRAIGDVADRVELVVTDRRVADPARLRVMFSYWITSWVGAYA